jgi:hypothetical protein
VSIPAEATGCNGSLHLDERGLGEGSAPSARAGVTTDTVVPPSSGTVVSAPPNLHFHFFAEFNIPPRPSSTILHARVTDGPGIWEMSG